MKTDTPDRLLLKPAEAADLLGVGRSKFYAMVAAGVIPSVRLGPKMIRISVMALQQWVAKQGSGR